MSMCCVRGCKSDKTLENHIMGWRVGYPPLKYIARICEPCRKSLIDKPIRMTYSRCGGLAFVNELWSNVN